MKNFNLTENVAGVRIFHAANFAQPVNIYIKDRLVIEGLNYREATDYIPLPKGRHNVKIRNTNTGKLLYNQTIAVDGNKFITISAIQDTGKVNLIVLEDVTPTRANPSLVTGINIDMAEAEINPMYMLPESFYHQTPMVNQPQMYNPMYMQQQPQPVVQQPFYQGTNLGYGYGPITQPGCSCNTPRVDEVDEIDIETTIPQPPILGNSARVRFVHLSPNAPGVDVVLPNGTKVFNDVKYKEATNYLPVGAGMTGFQIYPAGGTQLVLNVPNLMLEPNTSYTLYAIGLLNGTPGLELILLRDGI